MSRDQIVITWVDHDAGLCSASWVDLREAIACEERALAVTDDDDEREAIVEAIVYFEYILMDAEWQLLGHAPVARFLHFVKEGL
jgi:hypothetical protein